MTIPPHRVTVSVQELPSGEFRSDAVLPSGATVTVVRNGREDSIRDASNAVHRLAGESGARVLTVLPECRQDWARPYWELPAFRQYDPNRSDSNEETERTTAEAKAESDDGPVAIPLDELTGEP